MQYFGIHGVTTPQEGYASYPAPFQVGFSGPTFWVLNQPTGNTAFDGGAFFSAENYVSSPIIPLYSWPELAKPRGTIYNYFNGLHLDIRDIRLATPTDPHFIGWDLRGFPNVSGGNLFTDFGHYSLGASAGGETPTHTNACGVCFPEAEDADGNDFGTVFVIGYYNGVCGGEHEHIARVVALNAWNALCCEQGGNGWTIDSLETAYSKNLIANIGAVAAKLTVVFCESENDFGSNYFNVPAFPVIDPANTLVGSCVFNLNDGNGFNTYNGFLGVGYGPFTNTAVYGGSWFNQTYISGTSVAGTGSTDVYGSYSTTNHNAQTFLGQLNFNGPITPFTVGGSGYWEIIPIKPTAPPTYWNWYVGSLPGDGGHTIFSGWPMLQNGSQNLAWGPAFYAYDNGDFHVSQNLFVTNNVTAASFIGSGASLTTLPAAQLTGTAPASATTNAPGFWAAAPSGGGGAGYVATNSGTMWAPTVNPIGTLAMFVYGTNFFQGTITVSNQMVVGGLGTPEAHIGLTVNGSQTNSQDLLVGNNLAVGGTITGNGAGVTNLPAAGISTNGSTAEQVLTSHAGTVQWVTPSGGGSGIPTLNGFGTNTTLVNPSFVLTRPLSIQTFMNFNMLNQPIWTVINGAYYPPNSFNSAAGQYYSQACQLFNGGRGGWVTNLSLYWAGPVIPATTNVFVMIKTNTNPNAAAFYTAAEIIVSANSGGFLTNSGTYCDYWPPGTFYLVNITNSNPSTGIANGIYSLTGQTFSTNTP
jgi:hypothetical protein